MTVFAVSFFATCQAQPLNLDLETARALNHSPELKLVSQDVLIAQIAVREHLAANSPVLSLKVTSEYSRNLLAGSDVIAINNTAIGSTTLFQDSASLTLAAPLFYYDRVENRRRYDAFDVQAKQLNKKLVRRGIKLDVLSNYKNVLLLYKEGLTKKQQVGYYRELLSLKQRLSRAGTVSKLDMADDALVIAGLLNDVDNTQVRLASALIELSGLTGDSYPVDQVVVEDISLQNPGGVSEMASVSNNVECRLNELEIEKKKLEINIAAQDNWPRLDGYAQYVFYGAQPDSFVQAAANMRAANLQVGISSVLNLYDGNANALKLERLNAELDKLKIQQEKWQQSAEKDKKKFRELLGADERLKAAAAEHSSRINEKTQMMDRLNKEKVSDSLQYLKQRIDNALMAFSMEKDRIENVAELKQQQIMVEDSD